MFGEISRQEHETKGFRRDRITLAAGDLVRAPRKAAGGEMRIHFSVPQRKSGGLRRLSGLEGDARRFKAFDAAAKAHNPGVDSIHKSRVIGPIWV
jgi:hypothetical protein